MAIEQQNDQALVLTGPSSGAIAADYLSVFKRRIWTIIFPLVACIAIAGGLGYILPKQFTVSVVIEAIDRQAIDKFFQQVDFTLNHKPYLTTIAEVIRTRNFLSDVVTECGITEGYDVSRPLERAKLLNRVWRNIDVRLVEQKSGSDIIEITYTGRDAKKVMNFVSAIQAKYTKTVMDTYLYELNIPRQNLRKRRDEFEREFKKAAGEYQKFQEDYDWPSIGEKTLVGRRAELQKARADLQVEDTGLKGKEERLDKIVSILTGLPAQATIEVQQRKNDAWIKQKTVVDGVEDDLNKLVAMGYLPNAPKVVQAKKKIDVEREKLKQIQEFVPDLTKSGPDPKYTDLDIEKSRLEADIRGTQARIQSLKDQIRDLEEMTKKLPDLIRREEQLREAKNSAFANFDKFDRAVGQIEGTWNRITSKDGEFFRVIRAPSWDDASAYDPVFPNLLLFLGIGAFVGSLLGAGLAFVAEFGSRAFVTVNQVRRTLPVTFLGQVAVLRTAEEEARRLRLRRAALAAVVVVVLAVAAIHLCYFVRDLRTTLPTWLYYLMDKVYGA